MFLPQLFVTVNNSPDFFYISFLLPLIMKNQLHLTYTYDFWTQLKVLCVYYVLISILIGTSLFKFIL